jgi:hypothetical protein
MNTYIHIGLPKNASTTLETHLFPAIENRYYMGKYYNTENTFSSPELEMTISNIVRNDSLSFSLEESRSNINADINNHKEGEDGVIISNEAFSFNFTDRGVIAKRLYNLFDNAKVLIIIREQRSSIQSMYSYLVSLTDKKSATNASFGSPSLASIEEWIEDQKIHIDKSYLGMLKYSELIFFYKRLFGEANVTVLCFEELSKSPDSFVRKITDYLEVDYKESYVDLVQKQTNVSRKGLRLAYDRLRNTYMFRIIGMDKIKVNKIASLLQISDKKTPSKLSENLECYLTNYYKEDNRIIQNELNIDINSHGYSL